MGIYGQDPDADRQTDLERIVEERGRKFTKAEVAYAPFNFFLPNVKCEECIFFEPESNSCKIIQGKIIAGGLCHLFTSLRLVPTFLQQYIMDIYVRIPPYTTFIIGGGVIVGIGLLIRRSLKKK